MFITLDLVTVGKFCIHFSRILCRVVDDINGNPRARGVNHALCDAQSVRTLTIVGTVLNYKGIFCSS